MNKHAFATLWAGLVLTGCASGAPAESMRILNPTVASAFQRFAETMTVRRTPLHFEDGTIATNCETYSDARPRAAVDEGVHNRMVLKEYMMCDTVAVLAGSTGIEVERHPRVPLGEELRRRLDLTGFRSSLRPAAADYPRISDLERVAQVQVEDAAVIVELDDWYFRLEVVAQVDVDQNGDEDWLVWLTDEAGSGSYRDYALLIIKQVGKDGPLQAEKKHH